MMDPNELINDIMHFKEIVIVNDNGQKDLSIHTLTLAPGYNNFYGSPRCHEFQTPFLPLGNNIVCFTFKINVS